MTIKTSCQHCVHEEIKSGVNSSNGSTNDARIYTKFELMRIPPPKSEWIKYVSKVALNYARSSGTNLHIKCESTVFVIKIYGTYLYLYREHFRRHLK
jgi:hypothetical protein